MPLLQGITWWYTPLIVSKNCWFIISSTDVKSYVKFMVCLIPYYFEWRKYYGCASVIKCNLCIIVMNKIYIYISFYCYKIPVSETLTTKSREIAKPRYGCRNYRITAVGIKFQSDRTNPPHIQLIPNFERPSKMSYHLVKWGPELHHSSALWNFGRLPNRRYPPVSR